MILISGVEPARARPRGWGLADLAQRHGRDPRLGYAATLALAFSMMIGTNEPLAFGLGFAALALYDRGQLIRPPGCSRWPGSGERRPGHGLRRRARPLWRARWRGALLVAPIAFGPALVWNAVLQDRAPPATDDRWSCSGSSTCPISARPTRSCWRSASRCIPARSSGWRDVRVLWLVAAGFLGHHRLLHPGQLPWHGYQRVCAPALALGSRRDRPLGLPPLTRAPHPPSRGAHSR